MDSAAFISSMNSVTKKWTKQRKAEERQSSATLNRRYAMTRCRQTTVKDAAWRVMEDAYMKASNNGKLPAHARQIMYAARGEILRLTNKDRLDDKYFTQTLLPDFIAHHPDAERWNVVYDARGHFAEPHTDTKAPLGTIGVKQYIMETRIHSVSRPAARVDSAEHYPTRGPTNRYGAVFFIEKEGFLPLFAKVKLAERYDLAIMSTKGVSNIASRSLIDTVCGDYGIPLLVLHDFDVDGFKILATLQTSNRRFRFRNAVKVIDLGLRLTDVMEQSLEPEPVYHRADRLGSLHRYGATEAEASFLETGRVELNAFGSAELVAWIESKLEANGVHKVIPSKDVQEDAYRRALEIRRLERAIEETVEKAYESSQGATIPEDLADRVNEILTDDPTVTWDDAIAQIADEEDN